MKYLRRFNESISEEEYNRILDKISEFGLKSLTPEEKSKLDNFDGTFTRDKVDDVMTLNHRGELDLNPKYLPGYKEPEKKPDQKKTPDKAPNVPNKSGKKESNLISYISNKYDGGKGFYVIHNDKNIIVLLERYAEGVSRIYYIVFKKQTNDSPMKALKLSYNLNKQSRRDNSNFTIYDNNKNVIMFSQLETILNQNGLNFGDFNNAWHYTEEDYNSR